MFLSIRDLSNKAAEGLQLTPAEAAVIRGLVPKRELYARNPGDSEVLSLNVDRLSYWLFTSNPREEEKRAAAIKRTGDLLKAVEELAREGA